MVPKDRRPTGMSRRHGRTVRDIGGASRARIGVNDQLRVWQVLLQDERVHRVDDDIGAAVHGQRWLSDRFQIIVGTLVSSTPFGDGRALCRRHFVGHFGIAIL